MAVGAEDDIQNQRFNLKLPPSLKWPTLRAFMDTFSELLSMPNLLRGKPQQIDPENIQYGEGRSIANTYNPVETMI